MRCPNIKDLPIPPNGKSGWPWDEETAQLSATMPDGTNWPKISIVTPSFNQGPFLEETIRSVLLQGYPNLEYIIIDGNSGDNSVEIIEKYSPWITYWVSEPDNGQSSALNKGFREATGVVFGWLNSDDFFNKQALKKLMVLRHSNLECVAWGGACQKIDIEGNFLVKKVPIIGNQKQILNWGTDAWFSQPSFLFDAKAFKSIGGLDESLEYVLDVDLWARLVQKGKFVSFESIISFPRFYSEIKTMMNIPMRQAEHIFIDFKYGFRDGARAKLLHYKKQALFDTTYWEVIKYLIARTKIDIILFWKKLKNLSGPHRLLFR